jgi:prevent-host-death family protein
METIAVSDLRANLMKILKEIEHGAIVNITSRGKIVAKLIPPESSQETAKKKLKAISKTAVLNDIISPIAIEWKAME